MNKTLRQITGATKGLCIKFGEAYIVDWTNDNDTYKITNTQRYDDINDVVNIHSDFCLYDIEGQVDLLSETPGCWRINLEGAGGSTLDLIVPDDFLEDFRARGNTTMTHEPVAGWVVYWEEDGEVLASSAFGDDLTAATIDFLQLTETAFCPHCGKILSKLEVLNNQCNNCDPFEDPQSLADAFGEPEYIW